jgi:hypothetical protein
MANKNTKAKNRAKRKDNKRGIAITSENGGRFRPKLNREMQGLLETIKEQTKRIYG